MNKILPVLLLLIGALIALYPVVSNVWNEHRCHTVIVEYESDVADLSAEKLEKEWEAAVEYNRGKHTNTVIDAFGNAKVAMSEEYTGILNISGNGVMGYIDVPKIDQRLPIYHGTSEEVLEKGCGHLQGTSLPVGGKGTHSIIVAHRGLPTMKLFSDLDQVQEGDIFTLHILDRVLAYEVDQIKTVLPESTEDYGIEAGRDYVTLVTCTPYGVNTHRLLVRGHRTKYIPETDNNTASADLGRFIAVLSVVCGLLLAALILLIQKIKRSRTNGNH